MTPTVGHRDRVVVGVDGTLSSTAALVWAMRLATARGWMIEAVIAWPDTPHEVAGPDRPGHVAQARGEAVSTLGSAVVSAGLQLGARTPTVVSCVENADPVDALVGRSSHARLLVLGEAAQERDRALSVAESCSLLALCPVVIVDSRSARASSAVVAGFA